MDKHPLRPTRTQYASPPRSSSSTQRPPPRRRNLQTARHQRRRRPPPPQPQHQQRPSQDPPQHPHRQRPSLPQASTPPDPAAALATQPPLLDGGAAAAATASRHSRAPVRRAARSSLPPLPSPSLRPAAGGCPRRFFSPCVSTTAVFTSPLGLNRSAVLAPLPPPPSQPCYRRRSAPPQEGCRCFQQCSSTVIVFTSPQGRVRRAARGPPPLVAFTALLSPSPPHSPRVFAEEHRPHPGGVQLLSTMRSDHRRLHWHIALGPGPPRCAGPAAPRRLRRPPAAAAVAPPSPQEGCCCFQQCSSTVIVSTSPSGRVRRAARGPPSLVAFTALLSPSPPLTTSVRGGASPAPRRGAASFNHALRPPSSPLAHRPRTGSAALCGSRCPSPPSPPSCRRGRLPAPTAGGVQLLSTMLFDSHSLHVALGPVALAATRLLPPPHLVLAVDQHLDPSSCFSTAPLQLPQHGALAAARLLSSQHRALLASPPRSRSLDTSGLTLAVNRLLLPRHRALNDVQLALAPDT